MEKKSKYPKVLVAAAWGMVAAIIVTVLIVADSLLIPLVLAALIWYLINTVDHIISTIKVRDYQLPRWLRLILILLGFAVALNFVAEIFTTSVSRIVRIAPMYQENLEKIMHDLPFGIELEDLPIVTRLTTELDIGTFMQRVASEFAGIMGNVGLIIIYMIFLFLEQKYFGNKINMAAGHSDRKEWFENLILQIDRDIKRYVGVKTLVSCVTALGSWIVMKAVGLELAEFWAFLIFVFNYIPNVGSIAATTLPALLALLQFDVYGPFFIILFGIGAMQFTIGNLIEPALMGKSLNVSPLVIIFSLVFWGAIWGLVGMFLSVPITVIIMIILYNFEQTRWIARLLSRDGKIKGRV